MGFSKTKIKQYLNKFELQKPVKKSEKVVLPIDLINHGLVNFEFKGPEPKVLLEDHDLFVVSKPHNLHVHPHKYSEKNNVLSWLRSTSICDDVLQVNKYQYDRGALFRLDFETSGVLFFSKNDRTYNLIRNNFNKITKSKIYLAIVQGDIKVNGLIEGFFKKSGKKGSLIKFSNVKLSEFKAGKLEILNSLYNKDLNITLVSISLKDGLRHQIRAHLYGIGHPILGDELYGACKSKRMFLHAWMYNLNFLNREVSVEDNSFELFKEFFDLDCILNVLRNQ